MIHEESDLDVADNSGAKKIKCFRILGGSNRKCAGVGDIIVAAVQEAIPNSPVKRGTVVKAVIVRTRKAIRRRDGSTIEFDSNAAVILNEKGEPVGTRVFGPVARELREKSFTKILSLAPEVL